VCVRSRKASRESRLSLRGSGDPHAVRAQFTGRKEGRGYRIDVFYDTISARRPQRRGRRKNRSNDPIDVNTRRRSKAEKEGFIGRVRVFIARKRGGAKVPFFAEKKGKNYHLARLKEGGRGTPALLTGFSRNEGETDLGF